MKLKEEARLGAKKVALVAVMTAAVEGAKLALAMIPNVEAVTLLCAAYGYVFGGLGILATSLFVVIETLIWGVNTWVLSYIIHWNGVCFVFWILSKRKVRSRFWLTFCAVILTVWFGVLTSLVDIGLFGGTYKDFWSRFAIYYMRGIWFYVVQVACNLLLFPIAFLPLVKVLEKSKNRMFPPKKLNADEKENKLSVTEKENS